jgi:TonB family protein
MQDVVDELHRKEPRIHPLKKLDVMPKALSRRPPVYPSTLREAGRPGEALIEFYIDEKGDAQLPRIVSASAPEFGYAAAQAVATWRFEPPMKNGKPVIARAQIPVAFKLPPDGKAKDQPSTEEKLP